MNKYILASVLSIFIIFNSYSYKQEHVIKVLKQINKGEAIDASGLDLSGVIWANYFEGNKGVNVFKDANFIGADISRSNFVGLNLKGAQYSIITVLDDTIISEKQLNSMKFVISKEEHEKLIDKEDTIQYYLKNFHQVSDKFYE